MMPHPGGSVPVQAGKLGGQEGHALQGVVAHGWGAVTDLASEVRVVVVVVLQGKIIGRLTQIKL